MIEEKPLPWQELLEVLFRRRFIIAGTALLGAILALAATMIQPPSYEARAQILVTESPMAGPREESMSKRQIASEVSFLQSPSLVRNVLVEYQKNGHPMEPNKAPMVRLKRTAKKLVNEVIRRDDRPKQSSEPPPLRGQIDIDDIPGTNIIEVSYVGHDPEWAAGFVNDLLQHHVRRIATLNEERTKAGGFFREQVDVSADRWKEAQEALTSFRRENGSYLLAGDENHLRRVLSDLEASRVATQTQLLESMARVQFLESEINLHPDTIASESRVTENESVKFLNSQILTLEIQRSELLSRYTPTSSKVRDLERQIEEANRLLATKERETLSEVKTVLNPAYQALEIQLVETRAQVSSTEAKLEALDTQIEDYRDKISLLEATAAELERFKDDVETARVTYQANRQKEEEARQAVFLDQSGLVNLTIHEPALVPTAPLPAGRGSRTIAGFLVGMVIGIFIAFARDLLDSSIKGSAQAHRLSGLPVIAEIPTSR